MRIRARIVSGSLLLGAVIHLLPLAGVLGPGQLAAMYGVDVSEPGLSILMRHRAVLFGLLGGFLALSAFRPALHSLAFAAALASVCSFLALAWWVGGYNTRLAGVVTVDVAALAVLLVGLAAHAGRPRERQPMG